MDLSLSLAAAIALASFGSVLAALMIAAALDARRSTRTRGEPHPPAAFLVVDDGVVDASPRGLALLDLLLDRDLAMAERAPPPADTPQLRWTRLLRFLGPLFPDLPGRLSGPSGGCDIFVLAAADDSGLRLRVERRPRVLRLQLLEDEPVDAVDDDTLLVDRLAWRALNDEVEQLRRVAEAAPVPIWREDGARNVIWANAAYLNLLAEAGHAGPLAWPLPALFGAAAGGRRLSAAVGGGRLRWFDPHESAERDGRLVFALPADEAQKAERARREFVQTLTRSFATLPVGLAVFDRLRRLQVFNPALSDLTGLEPEFLACRPGLDGFLNRMRDKRVLPEPRDCRAWTRRLLDVEAAAAGGGFDESWTLPDGRSFRLTAQPHPDGALGLLLEDVTSDMRLKRNFRVELETGRAALDMAETALAVFSPAGDLVLTNAAFERMWAFEGADSLAGLGLREAIDNWRDVSSGSEAGRLLWDRIARLGREARPDGWRDPAQTVARDGARLGLRDEGRGGPRPGAQEPGLVTTREMPPDLAPDQLISGEMVLADGECIGVCARAAPGGGVILAFHPGRPAAASELPAASALPAAGSALRRVVG